MIEISRKCKYWCEQESIDLVKKEVLTSAAANIFLTDSDISGPMPSPGINVTV